MDASDYAGSISEGDSDTDCVELCGMHQGKNEKFLVCQQGPIGAEIGTPGPAVCSDFGLNNKNMRACSYFDCVFLYGVGVYEHACIVL